MSMESLMNERITRIEDKIFALESELKSFQYAFYKTAQPSTLDKNNLRVLWVNLAVLSDLILGSRQYLNFVFQFDKQPEPEGQDNGQM